MPKHTRIYTRTGDDGTTGLIGGSRVKKSALRIEAYGTVDELSSAIGMARSELGGVGERAGRLAAWLAWTQDALFNLGTELATPQAERSASFPRIEASDAEALERAIDAADRDLPALANFIHPGGSVPGARLHVARTICRRAERLAVALREREGVPSDAALRFLNRLSDALFVWSRWVNDALGVPDHRWNPSNGPPEA
ncbi:MAG: cob(I)yrinic acid a,c-diamide adenosyltransferase [Candidatus Eremiobacteraeota bacterium]|nr:cob(I)yrinic acid a,c-diamide adenosyltransferase [Candidatus Eremiobacteraeota bacterium]MBV8499246.1 cob(I)yrinic acid a,c-diamide adenosyltransferase [Candidatus Eremiobacteraeota bacterium]